MSDNLFSEDWAVVGVIDPDAYAGGTQLTAAIDMSKFEQLAVVLLLGDRVAGATVDLAVQASATSGGSYVTITGKSITQITTSSPTTASSNRQAIIHVRSGEITDNKQYVKALLTLGTLSPNVSGDVAVIVFGKARHRPAYGSDLTSVIEIVN